MFSFAFSLILTDYNHCDGQSSPGFLVAYGSTRRRVLAVNRLSVPLDLRPVHRLRLSWQTRTVRAAGAMLNTGGTNFLRGPSASSPGKFLKLEFSGISGAAVNGTGFIGPSHWKTPRKSGKPKKVGPFSQLEFPNGISCAIYTVSCSLYRFQVHGKKICHSQLANQNGFPRAHVSMHGLFFLVAPQFCTKSALALD